jgi:hypothetical protein
VEEEEEEKKKKKKYTMLVPHRQLDRVKFDLVKTGKVVSHEDFQKLQVHTTLSTSLPHLPPQGSHCLPVHLTTPPCPPHCPTSSASGRGGA